MSPGSAFRVSSLHQRAGIPVIQFAIQRILRSLLTLWIVFTTVFAALRLSGDPAFAILGPEAGQDAVASFRERFGLDESILTQYVLYMKNMLTGDMGDSMRYERPVTELFLARLPATLELGAWALLIATIIGIPLGIMAALRHDTILDRGAMLVAFIGQSAPGFFVAIMLILTFSLRLNWLPSSGRGEPNQVVMPAITLAIGLLAALARMTRSSMLEVARADYIRTATAKGLPRRQVVVSHMLRNASLPTVTMLGMWISGMIGGTAITETIFAWPGVGNLIVQAVSGRDYAVVQSLVLIISATVILTNLIVDLAYSWLDPRISMTGKASE